MSAVQLYGMTSVHDSRGPFAAGTGVIAFRDLGAVIAETRYEVPPPDSLAEYRRIVEGVFRQQSILPAPPGVVFQSRDLIAQWLELHYFTLADALAFVEDRAVARVRVERHLEEQVDEAVTFALEAKVSDCLRILRRHAAATVMIGDGAEGQVVGASYLVERERWDMFADLVRTEGSRHPELALTFTGPWPPYDFVRMQFRS